MKCGCRYPFVPSGLAARFRSESFNTCPSTVITIRFSSQSMEEAERLCDRVVIVDHGKVVAGGTLEQLYATLPAAQSLDVDIDGMVDLRRLGREPGVGSARQDDGRLCIGVDDLTRAGALLSWLAAQGHAVRGVASARASLENVFLALTGRQLRD